MTKRGVTQPDYDEIAKDHPPGESHILDLYDEPTFLAVEQRLQEGSGPVHRFQHPEDYPPDREAFSEKGFDSASPVSLSGQAEMVGSREARDVLKDVEGDAVSVIKEAYDQFGFKEEFTAKNLYESSGKLQSSGKGEDTVSEYLRRVADETGILDKTKDGRTNVYTFADRWWVE